LKYILSIALLLAALCKIVQPAMCVWEYHQTAKADNVAVYDNQTREIKIYYPLPYHNNTDVEHLISDVHEENGTFYNVVEKSYQNDTFYIKIQENLSAREQFYALSNAMQSIDEHDATKIPTKADFSLEDLTKVFPPPACNPIVIAEEKDFITKFTHSQFYSLSLTTFYHTIPTPPPNC
jgi:flagellar basal body L-ring protein FlgH